MEKESRLMDRLEVPGLKEYFRGEVETKKRKEKVNQRIKKSKTNDGQKHKKKSTGRKSKEKAVDKQGWSGRQTCDSGIDSSCMEVIF